ncbi:hypothetical protein EQV77_08690 [Halobacillus fulvus]|nr:hypothetical protein EQV77_08690 [Halobacillus fulvus]
MREIILILSDFVNVWHELLQDLSRALGWNFTDKELHFWVIGILGIIGLIFVDIIFHWLAKLSITAISFLFSFAIVLVIVFAIEIQQRVARSGNMEFNDAVAGIVGFLAFCSVYFLLKIAVKLFQKYRQERVTEE